jgi:lipopolysaccharide/colanic/teichoic acid biosynthesis glycosyltransferase
VAVGGPSAGDEEPGVIDTEWEAQRSLASSSFLPTTITAEYGNRPGLALHPILITPMPVSKRVFDAVGSAVGLLLLSPLFVCVAAFIKIVSPGPVFFKQERVGHLGTTFTMWKFRTMKVGSDTSIHKNHVQDLLKSDEPMQKLDDNDPQIIPGGRLLRKTAIDEFPQLFNVLMGDMSLVGPRPDVPYAVEGYQRWFNARHDVLPGMTGLWQVSGKNKTSYTEMMRFDATYSRRTSFKNDMSILLHTGPAILSQVREKSAAKKASSGDDKDANGSGPTASS